MRKRHHGGMGAHSCAHSCENTQVATTHSGAGMKWHKSQASSSPKRRQKDRESSLSPYLEGPFPPRGTLALALGWELVRLTFSHSRPCLDDPPSRETAEVARVSVVSLLLRLEDHDGTTLAKNLRICGLSDDKGSDLVRRSAFLLLLLSLLLFPSAPDP